jgi:hypothetical protein
MTDIILDLSCLDSYLQSYADIPWNFTLQKHVYHKK